MKSTPRHTQHSQQGGYVLVAAIALITVLLATGAAFMRWSTDESFQAKQTSASMQAYYLAQMGVVEDALTDLRSKPAYSLGSSAVYLPDRTVDGFGAIREIHYIPIDVQGGNNVFGQTKTYRVSAIGVVQVPIGSEGEEYQEITRKCVLYVAQRTFADYMYLSNDEQTSFGDYIKFQTGDTLQGRVHSNSQIALQGTPVFYGLVSSTANDFYCAGSCNPQFLGPPPIFRVQDIEVPTTAENLREGAAQSGNFIAPGPHRTIWAKFDGAICTLYEWETGTPFDSTNFRQIPFSGTQTCIFVDGPLWLSGILTGNWAIGSSHNVRLMDDVRYTDANTQNGITPSTSTNYLAIVAERQVKIANTPANGRENSGLPCGNFNGFTAVGHDRSSIVITAAVVALGDDFTFENQNDPDSGYVYSCAPDRRGQIFLYGSLTMRRRGYVHRSNLQSSGYLKQYRYDFRFQTKRPACFFEALDESGRALFNVVQWGQGHEENASTRANNFVRYN